MQAIQNGSDSGALVKPLDLLAVDGYDFPAEVYLGEAYKKSVTADGDMYAQGYANDSGKVTYEWSYKPYKTEDDSEPYYSTVQAQAKPNVYILTEDTSRQPNKRYYIEVSEDNYSIYDGDDFSSVLIYEAISKYSLPTEGMVAGSYLVNMINKIGANTKTTTLEFTIPAPLDININEDFEENGTITPDKASLKVAAAADNNKANLTYVWQYKDTEDGEFQDLIDTDSECDNITEPGWYRAKVTSTLNRATYEEYTKVARVTKKPATPVITDISGEDYDTILIEANKTGGIATLGVTIADLNPDNKDMKLISDKVEYVWKRRIVDSEDTELITADYPGVLSGADSNILTLDTAKMPNTNNMVFFCEVRNILNTRTSDVATTENYVIII